MRIATFFTRLKQEPRRRATRHVELPTAWTERNWADLPVHHPRQG